MGSNVHPIISCRHYLENPLEKISITEICTGANCSRNTFYAHFPYKEALYDHVLEIFIDKIKEGFATIDTLPVENLESFSIDYMRKLGSIVLG